MKRGISRRARWSIALVGVVAVAAALGATSWVLASGEEKRCHGLVDIGEMEDALDAEVTVDGDTSKDAAPESAAESWTCTVRFEDGGRVEVAHAPATGRRVLRQDLPIFERRVPEMQLVSLGHGIDGAFARGWDGRASLVDGYTRVPCSGVAIPEGEDSLLFETWGGASGKTPSYEQIATVTLLAIDALRKRLGCAEESVAPPSGQLPDNPSEPTPVHSAELACDTFATDELASVLPELEHESSLSDPPQWFVSPSPGADSPVTGCQIWRPPLDAGELMSPGKAPAPFGPMLSFQRLDGWYADEFDIEQLAASEDETSWGGGLGGEQAIAGTMLGQGRYVRKDVEFDVFALRRNCGGETVLYLGAAYPDTIPVADYEPLLEEWIHAQAGRDGCPIEEG